MLKLKIHLLKTCLSVAILTAGCLSIAVASNGEDILGSIPNSPHYQAGWQYSRTASGFTAKIPISEEFAIQPVFAFGMTQDNSSQGTTTANGHFALGIRGIYNLPSRGNFQPYTGFGWGHSENFSGPTLVTATITNGNTGYETFIGVEYQKYILQPTLEIGLGSYTKADGSYYAGTTFNFGLMYTF